MRKSVEASIVLGTRPEIIKLAPVIRYAVKHRKPFSLIHTGQHYSYEMDRLFFKDLGLPAPDHRLTRPSNLKSGHGAQTAFMLTELEALFFKNKPSVVVVQGDTNTVLAGALAASKMGIPIAHVEAGLRSYDRGMPEEINRITCDVISDILFAPTPAAKKILLSEGVTAKKIFMTGNTIVDAVFENLKRANQSVCFENLLGAASRDYFLLTLHRQENVDDHRVLQKIMMGLDKVHQKWGIPIVFPVHPRTAQRLKSFKLKLPVGVRPIQPVGFLEFLLLESRARLLLSDSGGVQEEGCILRVPCVTLRTTTERPETVQVGANFIAGHEPAAILSASSKMIARKRNWQNPFGDGKAAARIWNILERRGAV